MTAESGCAPTRSQAWFPAVRGENYARTRLTTSTASTSVFHGCERRPPRRRSASPTTRRVSMSTTVPSGTDVRPFELAFPDEAVDDLRRRLSAARWPSKELVPDASQGVRLEMLQALGRYWAN